jgi:hypothetical protein
MDTSSEHAARYSQEDNFFAGCFSFFLFFLVVLKVRGIVGQHKTFGDGILCCIMMMFLTLLGAFLLSQQ